MNSKILFILCAIFIVGCGGSSDSIEGIDLDANGVRDDIDAYIKANYTEAPQRAAVIQGAKAMQEAILVDTSNIIAVKEVNRKIARSIRCIYSQFDGENNSKHPARVSREIDSLTTNTKKRLRAFLAFSKALDGTSWGTPEGDGCE